MPQPDNKNALPVSQIIHLSTDKAQLDVFLSGAGIHNYLVKAETGNVLKPFAEATWQDDFLYNAHPNVDRHLQVLGGEWPCVPFGSTAHDSAHHGYCSNNDWQIRNQTANTVTLYIDYPQNHKIKRVTRVVELCDVSNNLIISLQIEARQRCRIPVGIHPIFHLPKAKGGMRIIPPKFTSGSSAPTETAPEASQLEASIPIQHDSPIWENINTSGEELIQIWQTDGKVEIFYPLDEYAVELIWNSSDLPHCLFWVANSGLQNLPIGDGFVGLGVEPTNSFFDSNDKAHLFSDLHNLPESQLGVEIIPDKVWETKYTIGCRDLASKTQPKTKTKELT